MKQTEAPEERSSRQIKLVLRPFLSASYPTSSPRTARRGDAGAGRVPVACRTSTPGG